MLWAAAELDSSAAHPEVAKFKKGASLPFWKIRHELGPWAAQLGGHLWLSRISIEAPLCKVRVRPNSSTVDNGFFTSCGTVPKLRVRGFHVPYDCTCAVGVDTARRFRWATDSANATTFAVTRTFLHAWGDSPHYIVAMCSNDAGR
jgi:hypothetical protein